MYLYSKYVPDAEASKSQTLYQLWGRPVLAFSSECDIAAASELLLEMQKLDPGTEGRNTTIFAMSLGFGLVQLIWMAVNSLCFCCTRTNQESKCYISNAFLHIGMALGFAIGPLILITMNKNDIEAKHAALTEWAQYRGCVDDFLKIQDDQVQVLDDILGLAKAQLALISIITVIQVLILLAYFYVFCRCCKYGCCKCK